MRTNNPVNLPSISVSLYTSTCLSTFFEGGSPRFFGSHPISMAHFPVFKFLCLENYPSKRPQTVCKQDFKEKTLRTLKHQWLQASRTRATLAVKRRDTTYIHIRLKILQVPFAKMSVEDRAQDLLDRFPVEVVVQDPCVRLSVQGAYRTSPNKIFVRDLKISSLFKQSFNDLGARPPLSSPGLCTRSPNEVSWQDLCTRS